MTTTTAVRITRHGGIDVLELAAVPPRSPRDGDVVVRTVASSINPVDWKTRAWDRGPAFPMVLGWDLAGIVATSRSDRFVAGDRVIAMSAQIATGLGTWSDTVVLPDRLLTAAPRSVSLAESATLPLSGTTALQALDLLGLAAGARLLVIGAAGAVGGMVSQLAHHAGVHVHAVVSRREHVDPARYLGADQADFDWKAVSGSYDAVIDTVGLPPARIETPIWLSLSDEPVPQIPGARGMGVQEDAARLTRLVTEVDAGRLTLRIGARFPVRDVQAAHRAFERGGLVGKVVLDF